MGFGKDKAVGGRHRMPARGTFGRGGQQRDLHMRAVNLAIGIAHIHQVIGRLNHTHGGYLHRLFSPQLYNGERSIGQVAQRHQCMGNTELIAHIKGSGEGGPLHVQRLAVVLHIAGGNAAAVHIQVHVGMVKGLEDVGYAAPLVVVKHPVEHHIGHLHGLRRGNQATMPLATVTP
ncbi:hypothetical protein ADICEAN_03158 [Cesiribacter andamanensis AMV16]|uniref:Uncharacterized protein n=1 Tax=Cesiribacter andamanensis AMV16 TaxID=1279009 RepID=M7MZ31_9BACT|nr:hypothetical protein ADICEAN_03158 [Cesiribacter andamanensis AMV16]